MTPDDPFLWLEEVEGEAALDWVRRQNARSLAALESDPRYPVLYRDALAVVTAPDRIPYPRFLGERLANFWQDSVHVRGLWRAALPDFLARARALGRARDGEPLVRAAAGLESVGRGGGGAAPRLLAGPGRLDDGLEP